MKTKSTFKIRLASVLILLFFLGNVNAIDGRKFLHHI